MDDHDLFESSFYSSYASEIHAMPASPSLQLGSTLGAFRFKLIESEQQRKHDQVQINEPIIVSSIVLLLALVSQCCLLSVAGRCRGVRAVQHQFLGIKYWISFRQTKTAIQINTMEIGKSNKSGISVPSAPTNLLYRNSHSRPAQ